MMFNTHRNVSSLIALLTPSLINSFIRPFSSVVASPAGVGVRINKCFPQLSRTMVDRMIEEKRVTVNGKIAQFGVRLVKGDNVCLDGEPVGWEKLAEQRQQAPYPAGLRTDNGFVYIKYFKGENINTTTSTNDPNGLLNTEHFKNVRLPGAPASSGAVSRLLPVGRLDRMSTGVLLLTSDARLPAWLLGAHTGCSKVYEVLLDRQPTPEDLKKWASGVVLSTPSSSGKVQRTMSTLPCKVRVLPTVPPAVAVLAAASKDKKGCVVEFTLKEGRNRQVRRMVHQLGYTVRSLHRTSFCGVGQAGLHRAGDWAHLTEAELQLLRLRK